MKGKTMNPSMTFMWHAGQYFSVSQEVNLSFLTAEDAYRSFRPGTVLAFVGGPDNNVTHI